MTRLGLLATVLLLCANATLAQDPNEKQPITIFGISFDKELSIPKCAHNSAGYSLSNPTDGPCYQITPAGSAPPYDHQYVKIRFPRNQEPKLTIDGAIYGRMVANRLQRITYRTFGLAHQELVYSGLVDKFGKPAVVRNPEASNKFGATFTTIEALWEINGATVVYASSWNSTEEGKVIVSTPAGAKSEEAAMNKLLNRGTDL